MSTVSLPIFLISSPYPFKKMFLLFPLYLILFFPFWPHCMSCKISVSHPGIDPGRWQSKYQILTTLHFLFSSNSFSKSCWHLYFLGLLSLCRLSPLNILNTFWPTKENAIWTSKFLILSFLKQLFQNFYKHICSYIFKIPWNTFLLTHTKHKERILHLFSGGNCEPKSTQRSLLHLGLK